MATHTPHDKKPILLLLLTSVTLILFALWLLDTPSGLPVEVTGTATQSLYINPRLEPPYTRISAVLDNGDLVTAEGPAGIPIKKNKKITLLLYKRLISKRPVYKYSGYLENNEQ
jgi:hypothetical protein